MGHSINTNSSIATGPDCSHAPPHGATTARRRWRKIERPGPIHTVKPWQWRRFAWIFRAID
jgi:hypothetical protein